MKNTIATIVFILLSLSVSAQTKKTGSAKKVNKSSSTYCFVELAYYDFHEKEIHLYSDVYEYASISEELEARLIDGFEKQSSIGNIHFTKRRLHKCDTYKKASDLRYSLADMEYNDQKLKERTDFEKLNEKLFDTTKSQPFAK